MLSSNDHTTSVAYAVRVSTRAKRARIEISALGKVKVVVPKRFDQRLIPNFVAQHKNWIEKTLSAAQRRYPIEQHRPETISLRALAETWQIAYDLQTHHIRTDNHLKQIHLHPHSDYRVALNAWLHKHARHHLSLLLIEKSQQLNLPINNIFIKQQKTRWGSCSAKGNINLNRNLLFLPAAVVNYLLVHELCHTVHLNHSPAYWQLVASILPDYNIHDRALRHAVQYIPHWALPD